VWLFPDVAIVVISESVLTMIVDLYQNFEAPKISNHEFLGSNATAMNIAIRVFVLFFTTISI
jgi:hypothetical protein